MIFMFVPEMFAGMLEKDAVTREFKTISVGQTGNVKGHTVLRLTESKWKIEEEALSLDDAVRRILRLLSRAEADRLADHP